jgi:hypothetical protein
MYQLVQKILGVEHTDRHTRTSRQTDRQTGDLISLFAFLESRLKTKVGKINNVENLFRQIYVRLFVYVTRAIYPPNLTTTLINIQ